MRAQPDCSGRARHGDGDVVQGQCVGCVPPKASVIAPAVVTSVPVPPGDPRSHEPEVGAEVGGEPPVVPGRLPVPRPPRVVAQAEAVDVVDVDALSENEALDLARTLLRLEWEGGSMWEAWVAMLPSGRGSVLDFQR